MTIRLFTIGLIAALLVAMASDIQAADRQLPALATDTLIGQAHALLELPQADKSSEKRLEQIVLTLGAGEASPASRQLLETLAEREPRVLVTHEEGSVLLPYVDVGAAARFALRLWRQREGTADALRATRAGDAGLLSMYFSADRDRQAGMVAAIPAAQPKNLLVHRDELSRRVAEPEADKLAAAFAIALNDVELSERLITTGSPTVALAMLEKLSGLFGADASLGMLQSALHRPAISSAALFQIGRLSPTLPAAEQLLWNKLADPELGGTAAAALARHADRDTVDRLLDVLQNSRDELEQKRALLALRLSGDDRARQLAGEWLARQDSAGGR